MNLKVTPLVSIIIPVFNVEPYLRDCLESVVNQSMRSIEIICVNDGSWDGSLAILRQYAENDSRIIIIDKVNEGQAVARNLALAIASGTYIAFVDSDDHIDRDLCLKAIELAEETHCDFLLFDYMPFQDLNEITQKMKQPSSLSAISLSDKNTILCGMGVVWTKFVRSDFLREQQIRFPVGIIYEDILVHWQIVVLAKRIAILPERLYHYRVQASATTQRTDWKIVDRIVVLDLVREFLDSHHILETYQDLFLRLQLESYCTVHDSIDAPHRSRVKALIEDRLENDHWKYLASSKPLPWRVRAFYQAIGGSILANFKRTLWLCSRRVYRNIIGTKR